MQYLFLATVGPVQDFIATARRSRDLWFGSWLLSELAKAAAREIVTQNGTESLIFPAPPDIVALQPNSVLNVANKILALITKPPGDSAAAARRAMQERLHDVRDQAFRGIDAFSRGSAEAQIDDLIEYYWVALPLDDPADYWWTRGRLEALMAARKTTRAFTAVTWGSSDPKSSLDGQRESVIPEDAYPARGHSAEERQRKIATLYREYKVGPAERLSGVDLLKRLGARGEESRFPSTSHVAALPLIARLEQTPHDVVAAAWQFYLQTLLAVGFEEEQVPSRYKKQVIGGYDGGLLFEERLAETLVGSALQQAQQGIRAFLHAAAADARPIPYYALLLADGDGMGKAIDAQATQVQHRALSRALDMFAGGVRKIVEQEHQGALVYAGGDDVLAFLPLHTVLACGRALAHAFRERLQTFAYRDEGGQRSPTLSVGIVVSHHIEPLSDALALARAAEKRAKQVPGKNALAVTVSKRSGTDRTIAGTWGSIDTRLEWFMTLHADEGALPDGAGYELHDLARRLRVPQADPAYARLMEATRKEAIRILRRKEAAGGTRPVASEILKKLTAWIEESVVDVGSLAEELIVARLFADATALAGELPARKER